MKNAVNSGTTGIAAAAETLFLEARGRRIAYRTMGDGTPIILANRFRGVLDDWDPAFLDRLAETFQVIIFDYSGFGLSSGGPNSDVLQFANDVKDLSDTLNLRKIIAGGWSFGGFVAQIVTTEFPDLVSHTVLIGTNPPGKNDRPIDPLFLETAWKPVNSFEDEVILFFEPASEASRLAARRSHERIAARTADRSVPIPPSLWESYTKGTADFAADRYKAREKLATMKTPILVISGDHEICFPVENWFSLTGLLPTTQLIVIPRAGHGPHHQHPEMIARYIADFVRSTSSEKEP